MLIINWTFTKVNNLQFLQKKKYIFQCVQINKNNLSLMISFWNQLATENFYLQKKKKQFYGMQKIRCHWKEFAEKRNEINEVILINFFFLLIVFIYLRYIKYMTCLRIILREQRHEKKNVFINFPNRKCNNKEESSSWRYKTPW